jgi:hypothetical protein
MGRDKQFKYFDDYYKEKTVTVQADAAAASPFSVKKTSGAPGGIPRQIEEKTIGINLFSNSRGRRLRAPATATPPGIPAFGTTTIGNRLLTFNWTAPASTGGSAITYYTITLTGQASIQTTSTTYTFTGLTNGTCAECYKTTQTLEERNAPLPRCRRGWLCGQRSGRRWST